MTNPRWRMPHSHAIDTTRRRTDPTSSRGRNEAARHQRALRILVVVLIPLGIWTFAGLIALWPKDVPSHINADVAGYSIAGVTYPTAEITAIQPVSCEGMAGSTPGVADQTCATIAVRVLDGDDTGKEVAGIPLTDALYNSGTEVGQRVTLIRIPPARRAAGAVPVLRLRATRPAAGDRPRLRGGGDLRRALARLRGPARSRLRRLHPGQVHVPGAGQRLQPAADRADRQLGDHVRRPVRRPRLLRANVDGPGRHPVRTGDGGPAGVGGDQLGAPDRGHRGGRLRPRRGGAGPVSSPRWCSSASSSPVSVC